MNDAAATIDSYLRSNSEHLTVIAHAGDKWDVLVPSYWKESIAVSLDLSRLRLRGDAFFMRKPDENADATYRLLLRRNHRAHCWKFTVSDVGDAYLVCEVPVSGVTHDELDRLFGALITLVDETYVPYMETAFGTALREQIERGGPGLGKPPWADSWEGSGTAPEPPAEA